MATTSRSGDGSMLPLLPRILEDIQFDPFEAVLAKAKAEHRKA